MEIQELKGVVGLRTFCASDKIAEAIGALVAEAETRELTIQTICLTALLDTEDDLEVILFGS